MKLCSVDEHRWEVYIEEGTAHLRCVDPHTEQEQHDMFDASGGVEPACAFEQYIDTFDLFSDKPWPVTLNIVTASGGYEYPEDTSFYVELNLNA